MGLAELMLPVHAKHYKDGYPLCWPMDQEGTFEGTWNDGEVTCRECITYMQEE